MGAYQLVGVDLLSVHWRAVCFQEIPAATQTLELSPATAMGMAVGTEIPVANPAVIRTGGTRAAVVSRSDVAGTPAGATQAGRRRTECLRVRHPCLPTCLTIGLPRETCAWCGLTFDSSWFGRCWRAACHRAKANGARDIRGEGSPHERREIQVGSHHQPLNAGGLGADHTACGAVLNYPHGCCTRPLKGRLTLLLVSMLC